VIIPKSMPKIKRFFHPIRPRPVVLAYLTRLMAGFIDHRGRMSAGAAAGAVASLSCHRAGVGRFLDRFHHGMRDFRQRLSDRLLEAVGNAAGWYVLILDATDVSQQGERTENTFHTGNRKRHPAKGRRYSNRRLARKSCHRHVMGLLLTPSGTRIPYYEPYYTRDYAQAKGLPFRTQADLGALIVERANVPAGARVVVVGDTAYESEQVRRACRQRGFKWILPANSERVFAGDKNRPQVWSLVESLQGNRYVELRLDSDKAMLATQRRMSACRRGPKQKYPTFYVHQERRCVHSIGDVQLVVSTKSKPKTDQPVPRDQVKILLTNDLDLSVEEIVALYALRWQIELFFKELKSHLGIHQYRFRRFRRVEAWVDVCLITFMYLEWIRRDRLKRATSTADRKRWQSQRTYGMASAVRQHVAETELVEIHRCTKTSYGVRKLRKLLRAALPTEYRQSV
jgi:hypothetical protein